MTAMGLADLGTVLPTSTGTSGPDASGARGHEELGQRLQPQLSLGEKSGLCKSARQPWCSDSTARSHVQCLSRASGEVAERCQLDVVVVGVHEGLLEQYVFQRLQLHF